MGTKRQPDYGSAALSASLVLLALLCLGISFCFGVDSLPSVDMCVFRRWTGYPCPGCGLTRAFCAISHGHFNQAFHFNPFGFIFYGACLLLVTRPLINYCWPQLEPRLVKSRWFVRGPVILVITMWLFGIGRLLVLAME